MKKNEIRTSKKVAKKASRAIRSKATSKITKTLGGATLVNRKARVKK